jgi:hypothetical protein
MRVAVLVVLVSGLACARSSELSPAEELFYATSDCVVRVTTGQGFTEASRNTGPGSLAGGFRFGYRQSAERRCDEAG